MIFLETFQYLTCIYAVIITVQIDQDNLPFKCQVSLKGTFNVNNIDNINKCLQVNATAILFPYVRSTLSMLTTLAAKKTITGNTDSSLTGNMISMSVLKSICWIGKQQRGRDIANTSATAKLVLHAAEEKNASVNL